nr:hypothetical protein [Tanacetum cinerariifolium]
NPRESLTLSPRVRTDNGTEFINKTLAKFFDEVGITQQFFVARTPQKNGVMERRNQTLVEAARTMLTCANLPSFLWAKAITTACFTQNCSIIHKRFDKTPYELMNKRKPNIKFFRVFGCRCYLLNDYEDVRKLKEKRDIEVFVGYSKESAAFRIYNKQIRKIHESVNIMKSSTMNVDTSINEEVFHEVSESFQGESSSSSFNDDVQQSPEELILPQTNTQSISNNMIPNVDKVSTSHNMFNERLEDAYFDATEALKDADWVSAMQDELDQFARLKEEVYVGQPSGFVSKQYLDHVYALDKALYGLKQAPQAWYNVLSQFLIDSGFQKGSIDTTLFIKKKDLMVKRFEMNMMGEMKFFLGLQVNQFSNRIFINQSKYILDILKAFGMENCDTVPTPMVKQAKLNLDLVGKPVDHTDYRSMIGSLMYVSLSRPDIMFATCMCARYQENPNEHHVSAVKRIFHCLKGTINLGLWYPKDSGFDLTAYSDADHAGCHLDRKIESKYVAVSSCCAQVLWMRTQLTGYGFFYEKVPIYCDSKSAIAISCNPVQHTRTKHIDVRYHFIKDHVEKGMIELYFVGTEYQLADLFMKSLPEARFKFLVEKLGMMSRET